MTRSSFSALYTSAGYTDKHDFVRLATRSAMRFGLIQLTGAPFPFGSMISRARPINFISRMVR